MSEDKSNKSPNVKPIFDTRKFLAESEAMIADLERKGIDPLVINVIRFNHNAVRFMTTSYDAMKKKIDDDERIIGDLRAENQGLVRRVEELLQPQEIK